MLNLVGMILVACMVGAPLCHEVVGIVPDGPGTTTWWLLIALGFAVSTLVPALKTPPRNISHETALITLVHAVLIISCLRAYYLRLALSTTCVLLCSFWAFGTARSLGNRIRVPVHSAVLPTMVLVAGSAVLQHFWTMNVTQDYIQEQLPRLSRNAALMVRLDPHAVFGPFALPNSLSGFMGMMLPIVAGMLWKPPARTPATRAGIRVAATAIALLGMYTIHLSASPGGGIAAVAGLTVFVVGLLAYTRHARTYLIITTMLAIVMIPAMVAFVIYSPRAHPLRKSLLVRKHYWEAAIGMTKDRPLSGVGGGFYGIAYPLYRTNGDEHPKNPHNAVLQLSAEHGIPLAALYIIFWGYVIVRKLRTARRESSTDRVRTIAELGAIMAFHIHALGDIDLWVPGICIPVWILAGCHSTSEPQQGIRLHPHIPRVGSVLALVLIVCGTIYVATARQTTVAYEEATQLRLRSLSSIAEPATRIQLLRQALETAETACTYPITNAQHLRNARLIREDLLLLSGKSPVRNTRCTMLLQEELAVAPIRPSTWATVAGYQLGTALLDDDAEYREHAAQSYRMSWKLCKGWVQEQDWISLAQRTIPITQLDLYRSSIHEYCSTLMGSLRTTDPARHQDIHTRMDQVKQASAPMPGYVDEGQNERRATDE